MSRLLDVILLVTLQVSQIVATPNDGEQQERLLALLPGYANVRTDEASWIPFNTRTKRQTGSSGDQEAFHRRDTYLPPSESRQLPSEDGDTRWVYVPVAKLSDVEEKRKWQGSQMVVWGKRGLQRPVPASAVDGVNSAADDKRNGPKHKWATAGNMAVWGK